MRGGLAGRPGPWPCSPGEPGPRAALSRGSRKGMLLKPAASEMPLLRGRKRHLRTEHLRRRKSAGGRRGVLHGARVSKAAVGGSRPEPGSPIHNGSVTGEQGPPGRRGAGAGESAAGRCGLLTSGLAEDTDRRATTPVRRRRRGGREPPDPTPTGTDLPATGSNAPQGRKDEAM